MNSEQIVYINLDDSGKLTSKERVSCYGGVVFISKHEKDKFITQYREIIESVRCFYCTHPKKCNKKCPEVKNYNIKTSHKRRFMNYIKHYMMVGFVIDNKKVYEHILNNKASKGRFTDYCVRLLIKEILIKLINKRRVDPNKPVKLVINIDQQTTKSNGYYDLKNGIYEELKYGIYNFNYGKNFKPILFSDLSIDLFYKDSSMSYLIQASDLLAGTIRRIALNNYHFLNHTYFENFSVLLFFPQ